jgi:hypothetical protein
MAYFRQKIAKIQRVKARYGYTSSESDFSDFSEESLSEQEFTSDSAMSDKNSSEDDEDSGDEVFLM